MGHKYDDPVQMIPMDQINVVNTRARGQDKFKEIVSSIKMLGLKKPITVTLASGKHGPGAYDLVCGEGRMLAFQSLGETMIPARVQMLNDEDVLLMGLVENVARRQVRCVELLGEVASLKNRGYSVPQIATKTDLTPTYISGVLRLLTHGDTELLRAVEARRVPLSVAVEIAAADDEGIQRALHEAYEQNLLRGRRLLRVREFIEKRRVGMGGALPSNKEKPLSSHKMIEAYRNESARQRVIVKQAELCQRQLLYVTSAMKRLVGNALFMDLLRSESLDSMPQYLAEGIL